CQIGQLFSPAQLAEGDQRFGDQMALEPEVGRVRTTHLDQLDGRRRRRLAERGAGENEDGGGGPRAADIADRLRKLEAPLRPDLRFGASPFLQVEPGDRRAGAGLYGSV